MSTNIESRLEKLERANRRWRFLALAVSIVTVSGLMMAQVGPNPVAGVVRTKRLEVVNNFGVPVVTLDASDRGGQIQMMTGDGQLLLEALAGSLDVFNVEGQKLVRLSATKDGEGMLATYNHNGEGVVAIGATKDGEGAVTTYNGSGQKLVSISATDDGGAVSVWNTDGQAVSTIRTDENGNGEVGAWDVSGKGRTLTPSNH